MDHCFKVTADNSFWTLSGLSQVSAEAWFHAATRSHVRPVLRDAGGWSDRRHLQRPGVCSFRSKPTAFHMFLRSKNNPYRSEHPGSHNFSEISIVNILFFFFFKPTCNLLVLLINRSVGLNDSLVNLSECLFGYYLFIYLFKSIWMYFCRSVSLNYLFLLFLKIIIFKCI